VSYAAAVLDGGWLLWRSAHACVASGRDPGQAFLLSAAAWMKANGASGLRVCWDGSRRGREAVWAGYKANRTAEADPAVRESHDRARADLDRVLPLLGAARHIHPEWEADDACASLARELREAEEARAALSASMNDECPCGRPLGRRAEDGLCAACADRRDHRAEPPPPRRLRNVLVVSGDKDLLQLTRTGVHVLRPRRDGDRPDLSYLATFERVSGVPPVPSPREAWLAFQAVRGDPGDGVPGVRGVGEARAAEAVRLYPDLLSRLGRPGALPLLPPASRRLLEAPDALPAAALAYELCRLRDDLPVPPLPGPAPSAAAADDLMEDLGWYDARGSAALRCLAC
jgi:5'-3' exonuclease